MEDGSENGSAAEHRRLMEIRDRLAAATSGPWSADTTTPDDVVIWGSCHKGGVTADDVFVANVGHQRLSAVGVAFDAHAADAAFIAAAREDIPWLLSIIDELSLATTCECGAPRGRGLCTQHCDNDE